MKDQHSKNNLRSRNWEHPDIYKYEETIALKIPGYHTMYDMLERLLAAQCGNQSSTNVLIIGAGGGQEIITAGARHKNWHFTGIDPSKRMLEIASRRIEEAGLQQQVTLLQTGLDGFPPQGPYDAATCMLVLHFVKEREQKQQLLAQIADHLKPGAPFFLASINGAVGSESWSHMMKAWQSHMLDQGISNTDWQKFEDSIGVNSHPLPSEEVELLLQKAGFSTISRYFGSYLVDAWFAFKNDRGNV
ncbi:SAM-dependent methyltransferase [Bacillus sp. FJAT-27264]|uniref:class I SAM-dependent methyltransferase n=1 Tax=Paenibacillus sp. (strain DSM 101736 / FJAT-27264) TaxID=1850362 RepID=UPI000807DDE1|nr:class I SAM-dependent methyltransferase [Bacillus sp. FJAT-27264]OBZ14092.1 SAM-dependent methyltransferase [Bacillus sp. FJAT-27264]